MEQIRGLYHLVVTVTCLVCLGFNVSLCSGSDSDPFIKAYVSSSLPSHDGLVHSLSASEWDSLVIQSKVPVIVVFIAKDCAECGILMPELEFLDSEYEYMLKFYTLDTDKEWELANDYRIEYHPITIVFKGGEEKERVLGYYPHMLGQLANKYL
ncbi:Thioredoxin-like superfamily [Arabidopsis suecica]|uniref:Thioredoxin-like superfamily n=1 Tax=Arabidopsis suecica TaxID=45249 RepID=A0A8T2EKX6_ARASU|nr:Thioredoxin-like superfamily [Arabidopsis suecica]